MGLFSQLVVALLNKMDMKKEQHIQILDQNINQKLKFCNVTNNFGLKYIHNGSHK